jgi:uncharacterized protein YcbX
MATIARIYRYPVKGLSAEPLQSVPLAAGEGLPLDRKFALARAGTAFDPEDPKWLPKSRFLMLMRDERLAELRVAYDDRRGRLAVDHDGRREVDADIRSAAGRDALERFFEAFMGDGQGRPRLVEGLSAWEELDWLDREVGAGDARFRTAERIDRCAATNVDPASGARDLNIPLALRRSYGHIDCGLLLRVIRGGELELGQTIAPVAR